MQKNLVIVESPAKAKTIEKFLGSDYKVLSSFGHIRDLKKKDFGVDLKSFTPEYEVSADKLQVVSELRSAAKAAEYVWLASDEDREGEAISWHLAEVLGIAPDQAKRIVFHEITKPAILEAIQNPRSIDLNLVDAQQARRVLDRLVGFKLSPVLWRRVRPSLSAGRVQSVAVRLIVEREREIENFKAEENYRITAQFNVSAADGSTTLIKAEMPQRFATQQEAEAFLDLCNGAEFSIAQITKRPTKRTPAPPFTTSTLQQEAARKLGFPVAVTMRVAQSLYESGHITYMRTDSMNLSQLCLNSSKKVIVEQMGEDYHKFRTYQTKAKGAQEAHEAIRPTYMEKTEIAGTTQEKKLYDLIWKRTIACQMADAQLEKTTVTINIKDKQGRELEQNFVATGEIVKFDGFLKVYKESSDSETEQEGEYGTLLPPMTEGDILETKEIVATQRFTQAPARFTEASLVHKLEELGIGRPSTYAPTISTIQQREYVARGDKDGEKRSYVVMTLKNKKIKATTKQENVGGDKGKLVPTDTGCIVNDFLLENFPEIMNYNFTARVEQDFDAVAEGKKDWQTLIKTFYNNFDPQVEKVLQERTEKKVGERELGIDPVSGKPVMVKIGRFGPMVQIGQGGSDEKPVFASLGKGQSLNTITLEEALELFKLPRNLGEFESSDVVINTGRFGPYVLHNKKFVSLPKTEDPMQITLERAIELICEKRNTEEKSKLKSFEEDKDMEIRNGRFGPYIAYKGSNYKLSKTQAADIEALTYEECLKHIEAETNKKKKKK
ncbi:MAG: type I DNA topoisomerase [Bacteroidaceae bacterium]|nr:type I DNA topoisomerase [Bacteroidaceae bacterium]